MTAFAWQKAYPGSYYLYHRSGATRVQVGKVWRVDKGFQPSTFYSGQFTYGTHAISFHDRAQPTTAIARLERMILEVMPDAAFTKENF